MNVLVSNGKGAAKSGRRKLFYTGTATQSANKPIDNGTDQQYSIVSYGVTGNASRRVRVIIQPSSPSAEGRRRRSRAAATRLRQGQESELLQRPALFQGTKGPERVAERRQARSEAELVLCIGASG